MSARTIKSVNIVLLVLVGAISFFPIDGLLHSSPVQKTGWTMPYSRRGRFHHHHGSTSSLFVSTNHDTNPVEQNNDDAATTDAELLKEVRKSKLVDLCRGLNLPTKGTKMVLLERLREFANKQAESEKKRREERLIKVENGVGSHAKERYEIVNDKDDDDELEDDDDDEANEGFFYFSMPEDDASKKSKKASEAKPKPEIKKPSYITRDSVIASPLPPDVKPNEKGERVVTVYSTSDHNDLTGIAAAQPGQSIMNNNDVFASPGSGMMSNTGQPWDAERNNQKQEATSKEIQEAKETVTELVMILLSMSGAPAFRYEDMLMDDELFTRSPGDDEDGGGDNDVTMAPFRSPDEFVGFDPTKIPAHLLSPKCSSALRADRGEVLQEVLREFEIQAIGQDGMAGDDKESGGGHYHEVSKVRAFLEGFRGAELRRIARETLSVLLDKLVAEGVDGLDLYLASMTRSGDDSSGDVGGLELNDSLVSYLNDVIRQQEQRVEQLQKATELSSPHNDDNDIDDTEDDPLEELWNVTIVKTNDKTEHIESIDPNDPKVKKILQEELIKSKNKEDNNPSSLQAPETAPGQLLFILNLLRERIKAEAAFGNDVHGRNLRILAYCLHLSASERRQLLQKEMGSSLDRMDSFLELVQSAISYAESTTHRFLQPAKTKPLNIKLLKLVEEEVKKFRDGQNFKASSGGILRP